MISDTFFSHGRYCGVTLSNMTSRGSTLHVRFYSDDYGEGPGFVAKYSHVDGTDSFFLSFFWIMSCNCKRSFSHEDIRENCFRH